MDWENRESDFLNDVAAGRIIYIYSDEHETTKRFRKKLNPPVLSAIRYLAKMTQYEILGTEEDLELVTKIISEQDFSKLSSYGKKKAEEFGLKVLLNSPNIEYASDLLDRTGLRQKLIKMERRADKSFGSLIWWMNKEPLRSNKIATTGKKASEIFQTDPQGNIIVSHETESFTAYESIVKSKNGNANVFISRNNKLGEAAAYGNGFYTKVGSEGARGTGFTVRFKLDPDAREGKDFKYVKDANFFVVKNKNIIKVIQDDIDLEIKEFFDLLKSGAIGPNDKGLLEKLSRKFERQGVSEKDLLDIEQDLKSMNWKENKKFAFTFWLRSSLFEKKPGLVLRYLYSKAYAYDDVFQHLSILEKLEPADLRSKIYSSFSKLDFEKIDKETEFVSDNVQKSHLYLLVALFHTYPLIGDGDKASIDKLDELVAYLMKGITWQYEYDPHGDPFFLSKKNRDEIKKMAHFVYSKVQETPHYDDDLSLMLISTMSMKSLWNKWQYYVGRLSISVPATSIFFGTFFLLFTEASSVFSRLNDAHFMKYVMSVGFGSFLLFMITELNKRPFRLTQARALLIGKVKKLLKEKSPLESEAPPFLCTDYLN